MAIIFHSINFRPLRDVLGAIVFPSGVALRVLGALFVLGVEINFVAINFLNYFNLTLRVFVFLHSKFQL